MSFTSQNKKPDRKIIFSPSKMFQFDNFPLKSKKILNVVNTVYGMVFPFVAI